MARHRLLTAAAAAVMKKRAFSPLQVSGLQLWLKADGGVYKDAAKTQPATANGDAIYTWADQSGNGNDLIQATVGARPALKKPAINGLPSVDFTGAQSLAKAVFSLAQPFTMLMHGYVAKQPVYMYAWTSTAGANPLFFHEQSSEWYGVIGNTGFIGNGPAMLESSYKLWTIIIDPPDSHIYEQDSRAEASTNSITAATFNGFVLGSGWIGDFTEICLYSGHLTGANINKIGRYMMRFDYASNKLFPIGDSKTAGTTSEYESTLIANLQTATGQTWYERPRRYAAAGETLATGLAKYQAVPYNISSANYVLMNFGANDVTALPAEAVWTANLTTYVELLHTYNPTAKIYIMRPWRRNYLTQCNSLATWIANVVTAHSAYCYLGPDERVFLENGDDGVTYTIDGVHANPAGNVLTAARWQTVMGY